MNFDDYVLVRDDVPTDRFDERGGQDDMVEAIGERDAMHRTSRARWSPRTGRPGYRYGSSKAALVLLTKAWAAEYGPSGVRVNAAFVRAVEPDTRLDMDTLHGMILIAAPHRPAPGGPARRDQPPRPVAAPARH